MKGPRSVLFGLLAAISLLVACDTALTVGSKTIGFHSGEFIYTDGYLRTTYAFPIDQVWTACEKVLAEMKAGEVERIRRIATGRFEATVQYEKVRISLEYIDRQATGVSIMVGVGGNHLASQLIHERLARALQAP